MWNKLTTGGVALATIFASLSFLAAADQPDGARRGRYQRSGDAAQSSSGNPNPAQQGQGNPSQGAAPRAFSRGNFNSGNANLNTANPNTGNPNAGNPSISIQQGGGDNRGFSRRFSQPSGQQIQNPANPGQSGNAFSVPGNNPGGQNPGGQSFSGQNPSGQTGAGQIGAGRGGTRIYRPGTRQYIDALPGNSPNIGQPNIGQSGNTQQGQPGNNQRRTNLPGNSQPGIGQPGSGQPGSNNFVPFSRRPGSGVAGGTNPDAGHGTTTNRRSFVRENFPGSEQSQNVFKPAVPGTERYRAGDTQRGPYTGRIPALDPQNSFVKKQQIDNKSVNHWTRGQGSWSARVYKSPNEVNVNRGGPGSRGPGSGGPGSGGPGSGDRSQWANNWNNWNKDRWNNWNKNWGRHDHHHHGGNNNIWVINPWWGWGGGGLWGGWGWPYYSGGWGWPYGVSFGYGYPLYTSGFYGYSYPNPALYAANYASNYSTTYAAAAPPPVDAQAQLAQAQPGDPDYTARGEAHFKDGKYEAALRDWQHAMVDDPQNGALLMLMGQALFAMGKYEEAAGATQAAMQMLPEDKWGVVVSNYSQLYGNTQDYTDQLKKLEDARTKQPDAAALRFLLGFQFGYLGYPKHAVRELDAGMNLVPTDFGARKVRDLFAKQWPEAPPVPAAAVKAAEEFEKQTGQAPGAGPPADQPAGPSAPAAKPGPSDSPPGTPS